LTRLFVRAAQEAGVSHNPDFNGDRQSGVGFFQVTQRLARRCSAAHAFIYPILQRPNFSFDTQVRVTRVLVENGRAVGVEFRRKGSRQPERLMARREVIVSSGSINSAKLLLLSGIGPADEVRQHGITSVHHLPGVGKNLQDHLDAFSCITLKKPISYTAQDKGIAAMRHGIEFLLFGTGAITSNVCEGGLFANTRGSEDWPDIQMHFIPAALPTHQPVNGHAVTLTAAYMRPQSRGEVTLASSNPLDEPLIDPKFLSHPDDLQHNIDGVKLAREVLASSAFDKVRKEEVFPGKGARTDAAIADYIRENAKTDFHPVGTCKMGSDDMSVVGQDLRVHGLDALRVIDASVMPTLITGNTNAPSIMIGERGADFILGRALPPADVPPVKQAV
jgi:choline dehydrogenase